MNFPHHDPAWLERMYNNRALVPDHVDYLQRWADASALARTSGACALDIAYGSGTGEALDIFAPHVPGRSPLGGYDLTPLGRVLGRAVLAPARR